MTKPRPAVEPERMAVLALSALILVPTSLRRNDWKRIGLSMWMRSIVLTMAGFQWIASRIPRAADGVITSYDTRSTFISGRVKQARSPETCNRTPYGIGVL